MMTLNEAMAVANHHLTENDKNIYIMKRRGDIRERDRYFVLLDSIVEKDTYGAEVHHFIHKRCKNIEIGLWSRWSLWT